MHVWIHHMIQDYNKRDGRVNVDDMDDDNGKDRGHVLLDRAMVRWIPFYWFPLQIPLRGEVSYSVSCDESLHSSHMTSDCSGWKYSSMGRWRRAARMPIWAITLVPHVILSSGEPHATQFSPTSSSLCEGGFYDTQSTYFPWKMSVSNKCSKISWFCGAWQNQTKTGKWTRYRNSYVYDAKKSRWCKMKRSSTSPSLDLCSSPRKITVEITWSPCSWSASHYNIMRPCSDALFIIKIESYKSAHILLLTK